MAGEEENKNTQQHLQVQLNHLNANTNNINVNSHSHFNQHQQLHHQHQSNHSNSETKKYKQRLRLPAKMIDRSQISIWSILKQSIGKELSKIAMPAAMCEPLSFLQRITENAAYCNILNRASDVNLTPDPCKRIELVAAFACASISSNMDRLSKPFNPILGETFELVREDLGLRIVSEQVSHHPPVSAFHADSIDPNASWRYYGSVHPKIKFWGKSVEAQPKGLLTIEFPKLNESYTWHTVTCCIHNIIVGKLWFEYYGSMEIVCHQTGYKAALNFRPYSWSNKEMNKVDGYIYDNKKNKVRALFGNWTNCFYSCDANSYDSYTKSSKALPMAEFDQHLNQLSSPVANFGKFNNTLDNNNFDVNSIDANETGVSKFSSSKPKFTLNGGGTGESEYTAVEKLEKMDRLGDDLQRNLNLNRVSDLKNTVSLPANLNSPIKDLTELWITRPRPAYSNEYYSFTYFAMCLNELKDEFKNVIAPTDSRFRNDVRQLELGNLDASSVEKNRLEEKQRESRKGAMMDYKGKWFYFGKHPQINEELWLFTNKYWQRDYSDCPNLF